MMIKNLKIKSAFTLAETLIVIAIIGVIAAMTLPTVINKYQEKQTITKLKKVYTTLGQVAMRLSYENTENALPVGEAVTASKSKDFVNNSILKYFNGAVVSNSTFYKKESPWSGISTSIVTYYQLGRVMFKTNDGIIYFMLFMSYDDNGAKVYSKNITVYVDLNGVREPNTSGKDVFIFSIDCEKGKVSALYKALDIQKNGWRMP